MREYSMCDEDAFGDLAVGAVSFSRDGSRLLAASFGYWVVRAWQVEEARILGSLDYGAGNPGVMPAWFSSDGTCVTAALDCKVVRLTGAPTRPTPITRASIGAAWYDSDGDYAWAVVDHHFVVRKVPDEQPILRVPVRER
jgi:hypothetical protein